MAWTPAAQATREEFAYHKGVSRLERSFQARLLDALARGPVSFAEAAQPPPA
jgi:hypothetical protein